MEMQQATRLVKDFPWLWAVISSWSNTTPNVTVRNATAHTASFDDLLKNVAEGGAQLHLYCERGYGSTFENKIVAVDLKLGQTARYEIFSFAPWNEWDIPFAVFNSAAEDSSRKLEIFRLPAAVEVSGVSVSAPFAEWSGYVDALRKRKVVEARQAMDEIAGFFNKAPAARQILSDRLSWSSGPLWWGTGESRRNLGYHERMVPKIRRDRGEPIQLGEFHAEQRTMFENRKRARTPHLLSILQRHLQGFEGPRGIVAVGGIESPQNLDTIEQRRRGTYQGALGKWQADFGEE